MKLQTMALVVVRLLIIHFFIFGMFQTWITFATTARSELNQWHFGGTVAGLIISSALLWAFSQPLANAVSKGGADEISFGSMSLLDCYTFGFVTMGAYFLVTYVPTAIDWILYLFSNAARAAGTQWREKVRIHDLVLVAGGVAAGFLLLVNARPWAAAFARHQSGQPTDAVEKEDPNPGTPSA